MLYKLFPLALAPVQGGKLERIPINLLAFPTPFLSLLYRLYPQAEISGLNTLSGHLQALSMCVFQAAPYH